MSLIDGIQEDSGLPTIVLGVLVVLLLLLASVIWVAFCMAIHRTAKRMAEYKRHRRRQQMAQISDPPPYEEAIRMDIATLNKPPRRSLSQPVAPERPLSSRVAPIQDELLSQGPPSYETAINSTESTNSSLIPTSTRENFSRRQSLY